MFCAVAPTVIMTARALGMYSINDTEAKDSKKWHRALTQCSGCTHFFMYVEQYTVHVIAIGQSHVFADVTLTVYVR